jgi:hypothetical protein
MPERRDRGNQLKGKVLVAVGVIAVLLTALVAYRITWRSSPSSDGVPASSSAFLKGHTVPPPVAHVKHPRRHHTRVTANTNPYVAGASGATSQHSLSVPSPSFTLCAGPGATTPNGLTFGINRVFDNAWLGHMCIQAAAQGFFKVTVGLARASADAVQAYPDVWTGTHYLRHTPGSFLPMPLSQVVDSTASSSAWWSAPTEPSRFLTDYDAWVFNNASEVENHGNAEIVIAVSAGHFPGRIVHVDGHSWREQTWLTCSRVTGGGCDPTQPEWPILLFSATHNIMHPVLSFAPFFRKLVNQGFLSGSQVLGSIHFGFECWAGCTGAAASVQFYP